MEKLQISKIIEQISYDSEPIGDQVKIIELPDYQTMHVEYVGDMGRAISFHEYRVDGNVFWAGYSNRTDTVFISKS
ncbi:MAG: hypothetical protein JEZ00_10350 [Anaerolineaceae bacterium]|nr:hypothetical protein [Anaerolineaceae bacterium]